MRHIQKQMAMHALARRNTVTSLGGQTIKRQDHSLSTNENNLGIGNCSVDSLPHIVSAHPLA